MQKLWIGILALGAVGCAGESSQFQHESALDVATRGVALADNGADAHAGMFGTTCSVDVQTASIGNDYDIPGESDEVADAGQIRGEDAVVALGDDGVHVIYPDRGWTADTDNMAGSYRSAQVYDTGILTLDADCTLAWSDADRSAALPVSSCDAVSLATDRMGEVAFAAVDGTVYAATDAGVITVADGIDHIAWSDDAGVLFAAASGDTTVQGYDMDGALRFDAAVGGEVISLDALGAQAAIVLAQGNAGELALLDGVTGELTSSLATPTPGDAIDAAANGSALAVTVGNTVHFFSVR